MTKWISKALIAMLAMFFSLPSAQAATMNFLVLGVIASSKNHAGVALLKEKTSGKVAAHRVGDQIEAGITITKVDRKQIELKLGNHLFTLAVGAETAEDAGAADATSLAAHEPLIRGHEGFSLTGNTLTVATTLRDHLIGKNLSQIMMQAASEPQMKDGTLIGFSLWDIEPGSIFDVAGFKNGDVITQLNGEALNDAGKAIRMLNGLRNSNKVAITYLRGGEEKTLNLVVQ